MLLRIFDAAGFDCSKMSWNFEPEGLPDSLVDLIQAAAAEINRRVGACPPWSEVFDKEMNEFLVLVRAWENSTGADTVALSGMLSDRIDSLDETFRAFINVSL
jgi:hypothetical protein